MADSQARRVTAGRMAARILRHQDFAGTLAARSAAAPTERVVLVALPEDRLGVILDSFESYGTTVNVVVPAGDSGAFDILTFCSAADGGAANACDCEIHEDAEIGMLLAYMRASRHPVRIHRIGRYEMELVEDGNAGELASV